MALAIEGGGGIAASAASPDRLAQAAEHWYGQKWENPAYRQHSAGGAMAERVHRLLGFKPSDTIYDLGCGTGRATRFFANAQMYAIGVDVTDRGLTHDIRFEKRCLWQAGDLAPFDWVYCVDVLHHIPRARIEATLDAMASLGTRGGFLEIGLELGTLGIPSAPLAHPTIEPAEWWRQAIAKRWRIVHAQTVAARLEVLVAPLSSVGAARRSSL
jgi:SAM-dependent methyltransferase